MYLDEKKNVTVQSNELTSMGLSKRRLRALIQWAWPDIQGMWSGKEVLWFSFLLTNLSSLLKMLYTSSAFSSVVRLIACDGED